MLKDFESYSDLAYAKNDAQQFYTSNHNLTNSSFRNAFSLFLEIYFEVFTVGLCKWRIVMLNN